MAGRTSEDEDLIEILSDSQENVIEKEESVSIINNKEPTEDELSEECQIVETEDDLEDLIVLDESVESRISGPPSSGLDSDSGQLEVLAEVAHEHRECCREAQKQITELQKFVKKLEEENSELRAKVLQIPETVGEVLNDKQKTVNVVIQDKELQEKYSSVIEAYVNTLLETERKAQKKAAEASTSFFVDKYSHGEDKEDVGEAWSIPLYDRVSGVLDSGGESSSSKETPSAYFGPTCFNCEGNHLLSACPQPHNPKKISERRRLFNNSQKTSKRYHLNSKFSSIKPGELSEGLRSALDLKPYQIPLYIYRMRVLGYPPGWLKEAEIRSSGLNLYDSDGKIVIDEENVEEGEVDEVEEKVQYDPTKLVNFPGFNMPVPPNCKDEHNDHRMPPLQLHQLRSEFEKNMKPPKPTGYRKHKLSLISNNKNAKRQKTADRLDEDMEIEITSDGVDVLDVGNSTFSTPKTRTIQLRLDSQSEGEDSTGSSPSVTSLEERRKHLLKELNEKTEIEAASPSSSSLTLLEDRKRRLLKELEEKTYFSDADCSIIESETDEMSLSIGGKKGSNGIVEEEGETSKTSVVNDKVNVNSTTPNGSCREILKKSVAITPGTPVISLKTKLPESDQFAKGISEFIPFENLPTSTGTYDKMRAIIDKTRRMNNSL